MLEQVDTRVVASIASLLGLSLERTGWSMLGIYGAGGLGRETLDLIDAINKSAPTWGDILFIDDCGTHVNVEGIPVKSLDCFLEAAKGQEAKVIVAVGEPSLRKKLYDRAAQGGLDFATLIHPNVQVGRGTRVGKGCIIQYGTFISCDVTLGDNILLQPNCSIGHDSIVGTGCVLSSYVCIAGHCRIGEGTYLGLNSPVREGTTIGCNSIVGMGSVVMRDILDDVIAMGNPARAMQKNVEHKVFNK